MPRRPQVSVEPRPDGRVGRADGQNAARRLAARHRSGTRLAGNKRRSWSSETNAAGSSVKDSHGNDPRRIKGSAACALLQAVPYRQRRRSNVHTAVAMT